MHVLAICVATMHTHAATGLPIVWRLRLCGKCACGCRRRRSPFWTRDPSEGKVAAEAALGVHAVGPTSKQADLAIVVPVVGHEGTRCKLATARWARDGKESATAAKSALKVFTIAIASKVAHLARRIPKKANTNGKIVELALSSLCAILRFGQNEYQRQTNLKKMAR